MSYTGKAVRMERIMDRSTWRTVIVPMDHGMAVGPIDGLVDMAAMVDKVAEGGANAVLGTSACPCMATAATARTSGLSCICPPRPRWLRTPTPRSW